MEEKERNPHRKIYKKYLFPGSTKDGWSNNERKKNSSQAVSSAANDDVTDKYKENLVQKLLQLRQEDWPNFIKSIRPEVEEQRAKIRKLEMELREEKGINVLSTQLVITTQDASQAQNTEPNKEKLTTGTIEPTRKIVSTWTQSNKDPGKKFSGKHNQPEEKEQTQWQRTKIKLNLTQNRFEDLETVDTSNLETIINRQMKQKPPLKQKIKLIKHE